MGHGAMNCTAWNWPVANALENEPIGMTEAIFAKSRWPVREHSYLPRLFNRT